MYINSVASFMSSWRNLQQDHSQSVEDLVQALHSIDLAEFPKEELRYIQSQRRSSTQKKIATRYLVSPLEINNALKSKLKDAGWQPTRLSRVTHRYGKFRIIDFVKDGIGLELGLGKEVFVESQIFVGFPRFVQANIFQTAIILMPMASLAAKMSVGVGNFESLNDMLQETLPLPLKYPFSVIGFSETMTSIEVNELTSELDSFLIRAIGMTLEEMALLNEQPNYDFKLLLPKNDKLAQEACGFANSKSGGYMLLGVDKNGRPIGMPKGKALDDIQLQITNVIHDNCRPTPRFEFLVFDNPENPKTAIIVAKIFAIERKPCMIHDKVYIRSGPSARSADSEEIRRLVLE